jgi:hypothetical protein
MLKYNKIIFNVLCEKVGKMHIFRHVMRILCVHTIRLWFISIKITHKNVVASYRCTCGIARLIVLVTSRRISVLTFKKSNRMGWYGLDRSGSG